MSSAAVVMLAGFGAACFVAGRLFLRIFRLQFEQFHEDALDRARRERRRSRREELLKARKVRLGPAEPEPKQETAESS